MFLRIQVQNVHISALFDIKRGAMNWAKYLAKKKKEL
jgi:hypothetical protein